ncbi:Uncharacterised protein [Mycobacterium tuberculosis]|nr:Uncharacterised protein [Mycobacterium tuberculosis]
MCSSVSLMDTPPDTVWRITWSMVAPFFSNR